MFRYLHSSIQTPLENVFLVSISKCTYMKQVTHSYHGKYKNDSYFFIIYLKMKIIMW